MGKGQFHKLIYIFLLASFSIQIGFAQPSRAINNNESTVNVVVIDPGHGGKDYGASTKGAREKDIVLDVALKLGSYINQNFPDVKVIYTRKNDTFIPLYKRAQIANKNNADLFISIHANSVGTSSKVAGTETFVLGNHRSEDNLEIAKKENSVILLEDNYTTRYEGFDPNSSESYIMFEMIQDEYFEQSLDFAAEVQDQFKNRVKRIDRGVKQAGFLVLRETTMPSVLVELGFISNPAEKNYLVSEQGKTYLASAIYRSFKQYKEKIELKSNFNLNVPEIENEENDHSAWYSVQIVASSRSIDLTPKNFKGEKNVFKVPVKKLYKYYSGKYSKLTEAEKAKNRIQGKYPGAFVVAFENNKPVPLKKAKRKGR